MTADPDAKIPPDPVRAEAVAWLRTLSASRITTGQLEAFHEWLKVEAHRQIYDALSTRMYDDLLGPGAVSTT